MPVKIATLLLASFVFCLGVRAVEKQTTISALSLPKKAIERPLEQVLRDAIPPAGAAKPRLDVGKYVVEAFKTPVLAKSSATRDISVAATANPKVEPGKVRWHSNFADACAASRKSGKPVFLFQMMGNLDDRFC
jgi:hypothetical protein